MKVIILSEEKVVNERLSILRRMFLHEENQNFKLGFIKDTEDKIDEKFVDLKIPERAVVLGLLDIEQDYELLKLIDFDVQDVDLVLETDQLIKSDGQQTIEEFFKGIEVVTTNNEKEYPDVIFN